MIKLFNTLDKIYTSNGDVVLNPTKAVVHKEDNGSFYLNLETGLDEKEYKSEEIEGQTIEGTNFNINVDLSKEYSFDDFKGNTTQGVPSGYTQVDYIQSNNTTHNTNYIDLGFKPNNNTSLELEFEFYNTGTDYSRIYGSSNLFRTETGSYNSALYFYWGSSSRYQKSSVELNTRYIAKQDKNLLYWNGELIQTRTDETWQDTNNLRLFSATTGDRDSKVRIYYAKLWDNGKLIRYMLPAIRNSDNAIGMFDIVNNFFYENKGTTPFTYGSVVTPTPDTPIPIQTTTGEQEIAVSGENLFNESVATNNCSVSDGYITITSDTADVYIQGSYVYSERNKFLTLPSGNYYFKSTNPNVRVTFYGDNGSLDTIINQPITLASETNFGGIRIRSSSSLQNVTFGIMLSTNDATFKPYQIQTYEINLGDIELCKIGDYQDRIYKDSGKWYIEKQIGKVVLDGSEDYWALEATKEITQVFKATNSVEDKLTTNNNCYCNYFINQAGDTEKIAFSLSSMYLALNKTTASTLEELKTWLSTHNTIVYYILATPTTTEITDTELINQLESIELIEGINNISSNGNLPIIMNLHYNYRNAYSNVVKYNDYLTSGHIIVANTPQGEQAFRITNIEKTRSKIKIKANHVFYDSVNYLIEDSYVVDKNCNDALDHLNNATSDLSPFNTISNVTNIASYRCVRKSLYEAIQVVLERWGGHLVRDNWTIGIYDSIGQDNGVTIRYAKNLKNITATYNWDDVVTKLMPVGKDGILLNAIDPNVSVYVEALNPYVVPFTKTISFSQDNIEEDNYRDEDGNLDEVAYKQALVEDLYAQATHYVEEHQVPSVNYSLSANVEKISDIGDTIQVTDERLGIDLLTHVISYDYDCILEQYKQLEFGNFTPQLSNLVTTIERKTDEIVRESTATIQVTLNNELEQATSQIWSALSDSYVIYEGDKILIVDTLPKEDATNVIMINNGGIGFSNTGINGQFNSAWTIDNVLNMEQINVINLTADLIKGGTLKLGSNLNQNGQIEVFDESNTLIAELNKNGLKMYGVDGSYVLMNNEVGFAGYDRNNNKIYWVAQDEFHMKKSVVEEEITLCNKLRFIPIEVYNGSTLVNDGIGLVSVAGGGN